MSQKQQGQLLISDLRRIIHARSVGCPHTYFVGTKYAMLEHAIMFIEELGLGSNMPIPYFVKVDPLSHMGRLLYSYAYSEKLTKLSNEYWSLLEDHESPILVFTLKFWLDLTKWVNYYRIKLSDLKTLSTTSHCATPEGPFNNHQLSAFTNIVSYLYACTPDSVYIPPRITLQSVEGFQLFEDIYACFAALEDSTGYFAITASGGNDMLLTFSAKFFRDLKTYLRLLKEATPQEKQ